MYDDFGQNPRITMIDDCGCEELKYVISRCSLFVGARTHATIAAYSSGVPTFVVGYSVKARGIARDLFGSEEHYVLPVQDLYRPDELSEAFQWLDANSKTIRESLKERLSSYIQDPAIIRNQVLER